VGEWVDVAWGASAAAGVAVKARATCLAAFSLVTAIGCAGTVEGDSEGERLEARVIAYFHARSAGDLRKLCEMYAPGHLGYVSFSDFSPPLSIVDPGSQITDIQVERDRCGPHQDSFTQVQVTRCVILAEVSTATQSGDEEVVRVAQSWDEINGEWYFLIEVPMRIF